MGSEQKVAVGSPHLVREGRTGASPSLRALLGKAYLLAVEREGTAITCLHVGRSRSLHNYVACPL